jgi:DNA primase large subunit
MLLAKTLSYYKRREVQKALIEQAQNKEIAVRFSEFFGKRPDILMYEEDVLEFAKKKATSFHCSEELWSNPLNLKSDMKKQEMEELRIGWDLILDIDCHHFIYSKLAAHYLVVMLKDLGISSVTCKFSGNKGFHLAVPFEAFPELINGVYTKTLFPEAPRKIAYYLRDKLKPILEKSIMTVEKDIQKVVERTGLKHEEIVKKTQDSSGNVTYSLDAERFLEIDTILIAPRHLYRMPYSLHEKAMLSSVPVDVNKILKFRKEMAEPEKVQFNIPFLDRTKAVRGEAQTLLLNAFDFYPTEKKEERERKEYDLPSEAIGEEYFPPCIKLMLEGLEDGKKRSLFTMINFLKGSGWSVNAIEQRIYEWNKKNPEPLREVYLKGQLYQAKKTKEVVPPHNCKSYYQDLRVCYPDAFCPRIKNPLQYTRLKAEMNLTKKGEKKSRLTEEQKEMRRRFRERKKNQSEASPAADKIEKQEEE